MGTVGSTSPPETCLTLSKARKQIGGGRERVKRHGYTLLQLNVANAINTALYEKPQLGHLKLM